MVFCGQMWSGALFVGGPLIRRNLPRNFFPLPPCCVYCPAKYYTQRSYLHVASLPVVRLVSVAAVTGWLSAEVARQFCLHIISRNSPSHRKSQRVNLLRLLWTRLLAAWRPPLKQISLVRAAA